MSAVTVYYVTLKKLAEQGNAEAALALKIGENVGESNTAGMTRRVCQSLETASDELGDALRVNERSWSRETDRCIERARSSITEALSIMAQR